MEQWIMYVYHSEADGTDMYKAGNSRAQAVECVDNLAQAYLCGSILPEDEQLAEFDSLDIDEPFEYTKTVQFANYHVEISARRIESLPEYSMEEVYPARTVISVKGISESDWDDILNAAEDDFLSVTEDMRGETIIVDTRNKNAFIAILDERNIEFTEKPDEEE